MLGTSCVFKRPPFQAFEGENPSDSHIVGQNPGTPVNIPKAFKIDYLGRVIIPKKVP